MTRLPDTAPLKYYGLTLKFPEKTVDSRMEHGEGLGPWVRLIPDAPASREPVKARYYIELGRTSTGKNGSSGFGLGDNFYPSGSPRTDLGDGYVMYCQTEVRSTPAFNCAVLLRSLPFAAIELRDQPQSADEARPLVDDAEAFLQRSKNAN